MMSYIHRKYRFINCVIQALNADWLTAVVYQTVYHGYEKTCIFTDNYVGQQFIIAITYLWVLWDLANIPRLTAVSRHSALRRNLEQPLAVVYWPYTTPPHALLLNSITGGC